MDVLRRNFLVYGYLRELESNGSLSYKIPKEINKLIEIHYPLQAVFEKIDDDKIIISDDGLSAEIKDAWRTIRFGEFLHYGDGVIFDVVFDTKDCIPTHIGIGCMTSQFVQSKEPNDYNYGSNHSMWIDGNGYFVNSKDDFGEKYKGVNTSSSLPGLTLTKFKSFFKKSDLVHLQMDMIDKKIRIWNDSREKKDRLVFEVDAPDSIAAMIDFCPNQKSIIKHSMQIQQAHTLQWDNNDHTSFSLSFDHNMSQTLVFTQISYDSQTYELIDPIVINSTDSATIIQATMQFEDPIDDVKQADSTDTTDYRFSKDDYQSITKAKAQSLLDLVHNGTFEYDGHASRVLTDGTYDNSVNFRKYPKTMSCPGSCFDPDQAALLGFDPTYGGTAGCLADCIVYNCEYLGVHWGAGSCPIVAFEDNVTIIESLHEAWIATIKGAAISYKMKLVFGYDNPSQPDKVYPNRWGIKYSSSAGDEFEKTCGPDTFVWDNGYAAGETYSPVAAFGNEYRKASYSLKSISTSSSPTFPITIGSYSASQSASNPDAIQAIQDKFSHQRIIIDDIGYHWKKHGTISNSSQWLFVNKSYFGFGCDQLMIDQVTWEAAACGSCLNNVLSTWSTVDNGISTLPYYADLDTSNGIQDAVSVATNLTKYSEDDIIINFKYDFPISTITLSSSNFAFKSPNVCNAEADISTTLSTTTADVSFTNCGTATGSFKYTITCNNGYSSSTLSAINVAASTTKNSWSYAILNCDSVSSVTITTESCPEFWNSTCSWPTTLAFATLSPTTNPTMSPTKFPTKSPSNFPTKPPTINPSNFPSISPTFDPSVSPTMKPTASPISFFESCTSFQVVPVRGAINNTIVHQEFCKAAKSGYYIIDINAQKPYYIIADSASVINTTINKINVEDYDTGMHSNEAATGSALIGHSIIMIEQWFDALAYLGLDLTAYRDAESVSASIKIDGLDLADVDQNEFKTNLKQQLVTELDVGSDQVRVNGLRSGSIIADIQISSTETSSKSASEINANLENYVANNTAGDASVSMPLNSVNHYFYNNVTNDIVFTNCPYRINTVTFEEETVVVAWDTPTVITRVDASDIKIYQAIGEESGGSFAAGSYFVRYVALSETNASIVPKYCSFVIVVDETEWMFEFMGVEFSFTEVIIIVSVLFFICCGSIIYSCVMRRRGKCCCCKQKRDKNAFRKVDSEQEIGFKTVVHVAQNVKIEEEEVDDDNKDDHKEDDEAKLIPN